MMNINIEEQLGSKIVLDTRKIAKIKKYIEIKYNNLSKKDRADMLSNTIHVILTNCLNTIDEDLKKAIRIHTLKNTLLNGKNQITYYDILLSLKSDKFNLSQNTINTWINSYFPENIIVKPDFSTKPPTEIKKDTTPLKSNDTDKLHIENKPTNKNPVKNKSGTKKFKIALCTFLILLVFTCGFAKISTSKKQTIKQYKNIKYATLLSSNNEKSGIPLYFKYVDIDEVKLKKYLKNRNSLLEEEPYFSTIIKSAKEFNLNPLIIFAISGQEQSFVPKHEKHAKKIANNPFNVFHSWMEYNTNIKDSSRIVARTINNLCKDKPVNENPFKWINRQYAEDKNWHKGVEALYNEMLKYIVEN